MLEATLVCIDNSEWMRNGDYTPTRLEAQQDAVNMICNAKTQVNPESTVGLMTYAGSSPEVLVTLTSDLGKIITNLHNVRIKGAGNVMNGIQVAQLALKHRQNKNQRQRIILFVGSPIQEDERSLVRLGKKLKKNNVAVDVINFGEEAENTGKLEAFIAAVNSGDNSHLVTVPPGPHILSDILISSPIIAEGGEAAAMAAAASRRGGGGGGFDFGGEAGFDPELEMALRISMEEERARQEAQAAAASSATMTEGAGGAGSVPTSEQASTTAKSEPAVDAMDISQFGDSDSMFEEDEEAMLARALAMSMEGSSSTQEEPHNKTEEQGKEKDNQKQ